MHSSVFVSFYVKRLFGIWQKSDEVTVYEQCVYDTEDALAV